MQLELTNVVNVSVAEVGAGIGEYNTSNIALFSHEAFDPDLFGDDGFKIYLEPTEVGDDFGTDSNTYKEALAIFSQQPNIRAGNGYLVVIPFVEAEQNFALSGIPASGSFTLSYLGNPTASIQWDDTADEIEAKLRAVAGLETVTVTGSLASQAIQIQFAGVYGAVALLTVGGAGLMTSAPAAITITPTTTQAGETLAVAIARTKDLVQYFGVIGSLIFSQVDMLAAAAVVEALNKIAFFVSDDAASVDPGGLLDLLRSGNLHKSRGLYYGGATEADTLVMMASYASRGLSVDFAGSNTTLTMQLKDLIGVQPDPSMTQTIKAKAETAGVDIYVSLQGVAKVLSFGANKFFDQVYNLEWLVGALQVAVFNLLAQTSTKIPQTEQGMNQVKSAARQVCAQGVTNQYLSPGLWTSPVTFGSQADLLRNVSEYGYYLYSVPVAQQSPAARAARIAPLLQIAVKEAGAIHTANIIVNVNA